MVHPVFSSPETFDVETVIVQDVQEPKCLQISTWTTISEANGTKKLVLHEEANTQDGAVQHPPSQVVEKPLLSGGGNLKVYTWQEPIPLQRVAHPHSDPCLPLSRAECSSIKGCPSSAGIVVPAVHVKHNADHMDKAPVTPKRQRVQEMDVAGQFNHLEDSSTHMEGVQSLSPWDNDHLQYTPVVISEEHLQPSQANLSIPNNYTPALQPQCTLFIFKEDPFIQTSSAGGDPVQVNPQANSCGEQNLIQSTSYSSNTHCITYTIS